MGFAGGANLDGESSQPPAAKSDLHKQGAVRLRRVSSNEDHLTAVLHRLLTSSPMLNYIKKVHQCGSPIYHPVPRVLLPDSLEARTTDRLGSIERLSPTDVPKDLSLSPDAWCTSKALHIPEETIDRFLSSV